MSIRTLTTIRLGLGIGLAFVGASLSLPSHSAPGSTDHTQASVAHQSKEAPVTGHRRTAGTQWIERLWIVQVWNEFVDKVDRLRAMDEKLEFYRRQLAEMQVEHGKLFFDSIACREQARAAVIKHKAKEEGGVETARTIASLRPAAKHSNLLEESPSRIFEISAQAFSEGDYETAGRGFSYLLEGESNDAESSRRTAQTYYLGGVSLYQLKNYRRAKVYLEHALGYASAAPHDANDVAYGPRALAWIALCHAKLGNSAGKAQTIRYLIEKYPRSKEAMRLNRRV